MCEEEEREDTVNSQDLSGTPCPLPPPPPPPLPPPPALSIFPTNQLFIPLHHHTMGGMHRIYMLSGICTHTRMESHTHFEKETLPSICACGGLYTQKKQKLYFSFIKNTRQRLLKYSHTAEMKGGRRVRVTEILKDLLRQKDKEISF